MDLGKFLTGKEKVMAVIPARGGSKGLPRKNILPVDGKPLIAWTIDAALMSKVVNKVILSSDDDEIIKVASLYGCEAPFVRPKELATDSATSIDVVLHAIEHLPGYDFVILLQPTSPLRHALDIDGAFAQMLSMGASTCVSVSEVDQSPYWMYSLNSSGRLESLLPPLQGVTRRQDLPPVYGLNGAIYIARIEEFLRTGNFVGDNCVAYEMPKNRSLDIDTVEDFNLLKKLTHANQL